MSTHLITGRSGLPWRSALAVAVALACVGCATRPDGNPRDPFENYNRGMFALSAEWGRIVTGSVLASPANPAMPRAGDNKLHVNLSARF